MEGGDESLPSSHLPALPCAMGCGCHTAFLEVPVTPWKNNFLCPSVAQFSICSHRAAVEVAVGCLHLLSLHDPTRKPCGGGQWSWSTVRCLLTLNSVSQRWASSARRASWGRAPGRQQRELGARHGTHCSPGTAALPHFSVTIKAHQKDHSAGPAHGLHAGEGGDLLQWGVAQPGGTAAAWPPAPARALSLPLPRRRHERATALPQPFPWSAPCTACSALGLLLTHPVSGCLGTRRGFGSPMG